MDGGRVIVEVGLCTNVPKGQQSHDITTRFFC